MPRPRPLPHRTATCRWRTPADNDAHGTGTVNSVDPAQHKVNLSHNPIPEIGWPAMTMEFPVAPSVDLKAIKPGTRVNFTIEQQPGGMYEIQRDHAGGRRDDDPFIPALLSPAAASCRERPPPARFR